MGTRRETHVCPRKGLRGAPLGADQRAERGLGGEGEAGPGTQGSSFLKKARKEIEPVKGRKCRICRKGAEGANSEAWNVQFGPSFPAPVLLPWLVRLGGKTEEQAVAAWEGDSRGQQGRVSQVRCWRRGPSCGVWKMSVPAPPTPTAPAPPGQPLTHLHDKPQTLCSIQGACSWDNPMPA